MPQPWLKGSAIAAVMAAALLTAGPAPGQTTLSPGWLASLQGVFVPDPSHGADYEAVFLRGKDPVIVHRKGVWLRVSEGTTEQRFASYVGLSTGSQIVVASDAQGRYASIFIRRSKPSPKTDYRSFKTSERRQVLGEPCEVWSVWREEPPAPKQRPLQRIGCVTADGIELWRRREDQHPAEAVQVTRRRFDAEEVQPPRDLLDLAPWVGDASAAPSAGDYEVMLKGARPGSSITIRRHGDWLYNDVRYPAGRSVESRRADDSVALYFSLSAGGADRSLDFRRPNPSTRARVQTLGRWEVVNGERCQWVNLVTDIEDDGRRECRAADGAPLKITEWSWGTERNFTAVFVSRAKLRMADVLPPKALLDPKRWGLPH
jgi:hypothetical protein